MIYRSSIQLRRKLRYFHIYCKDITFRLTWYPRKYLVQGIYYTRFKFACFFTSSWSAASCNAVCVTYKLHNIIFQLVFYVEIFTDELQDSYLSSYLKIPLTLKSRYLWNLPYQTHLPGMFKKRGGNYKRQNSVSKLLCR